MKYGPRSSWPSAMWSLNLNKSRSHSWTATENKREERKKGAWVKGEGAATATEGINETWDCCATVRDQGRMRAAGDNERMMRVSADRYQQFYDHTFYSSAASQRRPRVPHPNSATGCYIFRDRWDGEEAQTENAGRPLLYNSLFARNLHGQFHNATATGARSSWGKSQQKVILV